MDNEKKGATGDRMTCHHQHLQQQQAGGSQGTLTEDERSEDHLEAERQLDAIMEELHSITSEMSQAELLVQDFGKEFLDWWTLHLPFPEVYESNEALIDEIKEKIVASINRVRERVSNLQQQVAHLAWTDCLEPIKQNLEGINSFVERVTRKVEISGLVQQEDPPTDCGKLLETIAYGIKKDSEEAAFSAEFVYDLLMQIDKWLDMIGYEMADPNPIIPLETIERRLSQARKYLHEALINLFKSQINNAQELNTILQWVREHSELPDVSGDGSCLFRAAVAAISPRKRESDLLQEVDADLLRKKIACRMSQAPELYCEFVEIERLKEFVEEGEYIEDKRCRENAFMRYCKALDNNLQDTKMWGGYVEIMAIAEQYERPVFVLRPDDPGLTAVCTDGSAQLVPSQAYQIATRRFSRTTPIRLYYDPSKQHYATLVSNEQTYDEAHEISKFENTVNSSANDEGDESTAEQKGHFVQSEIEGDYMESEGHDASKTQEEDSTEDQAVELAFDKLGSVNAIRFTQLRDLYLVLESRCRYISTSVQEATNSLFEGNSVSDREIRSAIMDSIKSEALSIKNDLQQLAEFVCRRMMAPARSHDRLKIISDGDDLCVHLIGNKGQGLKERIHQLEQDVDDYLSTCELIFLQQQPSSVTLPDTPDAGYSPEVCSQEEGEEQDNQLDEEAFSLTQKKHSHQSEAEPRIWNQHLVQESKRGAQILGSLKNVTAAKRELEEETSDKTASTRLQRKQRVSQESRLIAQENKKYLNEEIIEDVIIDSDSESDSLTEIDEEEDYDEDHDDNIPSSLESPFFQPRTATDPGNGRPLETTQTSLILRDLHQRYVRVETGNEWSDEDSFFVACLTAADMVHTVDKFVVSTFKRQVYAAMRSASSRDETGLQAGDEKRTCGDDGQRGNRALWQCVSKLLDRPLCVVSPQRFVTVTAGSHQGSSYDGPLTMHIYQRPAAGPSSPSPPQPRFDALLPRLSSSTSPLSSSSSVHGDEPPPQQRQQTSSSPSCDMKLETPS